MGGASGGAVSNPDIDTVFDEWERIRAAVMKLPPEQREVFTMRMDAGMPFKEIAKLQGTSINTALARMQYAMGKLREMLQNDYAVR